MQWPVLLVLLLMFTAGWSPLRAEDFAVRIFTNASGQSIPYRLLVPKNYDPKQKYPLVLFLHGASGRGTDNAEPLNWGPKFFLEPERRKKFPCFLVVPQCPKDQGWLAADETGVKEGRALSLALELVGTALPKEFSIDSKRRHLTGVSMGGHAVWVCLVRHPGFFASGAPVCGGGDTNSVTSRMTRTPVWAFHSDDDHLVPVQSARDMIKAWRENGGTAKYTEYTGLKHSSWKKAYLEPELFEWWAGQRRP